MIARRMFNFPRMAWQHPFTEMDRMFREMDQLTGALTGRSTFRLVPPRVFPAVNITESKDSYHVRAELPGMKAEDIELQVKGRNLAISGERRISSEGDHVKYHRSEREAGRFSRMISLPGDIDEDRVDAKMVNGVLTVTLAKSEASKPKQITVH